MDCPRHLLISLSEELGPILEATRHQPSLNQIELVLVEPGVFGIVHNEFEIWRDAERCQSSTGLILALNYSQRWLPRAEVNARDLAFRMLVGCVNG
jgi:hypothetical protein